MSYAGVYPPLSGWFSHPERVFLLAIKLGGTTGTGLKRGIAYFRYCKIFAKIGRASCRERVYIAV
jgi:hypothetical protein